MKQIEAKKTFFITMSNPSQNVIDELLTSFIFLGKLVHLIEKEEPHMKQSLVEKMTKEDLEIYLAFKRQLEEINKQSPQKVVRPVVRRMFVEVRNNPILVPYA